MAATPVTVVRKKGHSPLLLILLGLIVLFFWLIGTMLELQTSEAFILGIAPSTPNWGIFMQPIDALRGLLSITMVEAMMWAYGVEMIYFVFVIAFTLVYEVFGRSHPWVGRTYVTVSIVIIVFNAWSNFQYGNLPFLGQIGFALITAFATAFFEVIGIRLIEAAFSEIFR